MPAPEHRLLRPAETAASHDREETPWLAPGRRDFRERVDCDTRIRRWGKVLGIIAAVVVLLIVTMMAIGGGATTLRVTVALVATHRPPRSPGTCPSVSPAKVAHTGAPEGGHR